MKLLIISIIAMVGAMLASTAVQAQDDTLSELVGRGLGAYGAAKLCGKGPATAAGCGAVGAELGAKIVSKRKQYPAARTYVPRPQYPETGYAEPRRQCWIDQATTQSGYVMEVELCNDGRYTDIARAKLLGRRR